MQDIDVGQLSEAINDKADRDLNNTNATLPGLNAVLPNDMDYVVESQEPTADNNYTWYRLYKSGWVEQGGEITGGAQNVNFYKEFADTNYSINIQQVATGSTSASYFGAMKVDSLTTTYFHYVPGQTENPKTRWEAKGMAAQD